MAKPVVTDKPIVDQAEFNGVTYKLQIDANAIRVDHILLENVKDSVVSKGFKNEEAWAEIVQDTDNLFMKLDDFEMSPEDFDEDGLETLKTMIGSSSVECSQLMIDTESDIKITLLDEDDEEVCSIDLDEVPRIYLEQCYDTSIDDLDEEDEDDANKKAFLLRHPEFAGDDVLGLHLDQPSTWYWANVQECEMEDSLIYEIKVKGDFDVKKLRFVDVLAEEWCNGLKPFDVICAIEYDGVMATLQDPDVAEESGTNIFIKTSKNPLPAKAFDFTNGEKM